MPTLSELNNDSYNELNDIFCHRINLQNLYFGDIRSSESFDFLCHEWIKRQNKNNVYKFTDEQTVLIALLKGKKHILIPKDRQVGETLATSIYLTHEIYYNQRTVLILGPSRNSTNYVVEMIRFMLNTIITRNNKTKTEENKTSLCKGPVHSIELYGTKYVNSAVNVDGLRGVSTDIIYMTEAAFNRHGVDLFESAYQCLNVRHSTQLIISSSYNGQDNFFVPLLERVQGNPNYVIFPIINPFIPENDPDRWPFR